MHPTLIPNYTLREPHEPTTLSERIYRMYISSVNFLPLTPDITVFHSPVLFFDIKTLIHPYFRETHDYIDNIIEVSLLN